jgi:hypothetical protein
LFLNAELEEWLTSAGQLLDEWSFDSSDILFKPGVGTAAND